MTLSTSGRTIQDRRANSRLPVQLECEYEWNTTVYKATLMDISMTGAFVLSRGVPPERSRVSLVLTAPGSKQVVRVEARVARGGWRGGWGRGPGFGIRFTTVTRELVELFKDVMKDSEAKICGFTARSA
jgi:hypothetical protein